MGTIMAAFACGVPMLCLPLGRDQHGNARSVEELRAGSTIQREASIDEIRSAAVELLGSEELRVGARRMTEVVSRYGPGTIAVRELEQLLPAL
jgi:UDP:flavonoid glycosyltransferase YjiC (YdhE family)